MAEEIVQLKEEVEMLKQEKLGWKPSLNFLLQHWRLEFYQLALPYSSLANLIFCFKFLLLQDLSYKKKNVTVWRKLMTSKIWKSKWTALIVYLENYNPERKSLTSRIGSRLSHCHQIRTVLGITQCKVKTNNSVWTFL